MPKKLALQAVFNESRKRWRVDVPPHMADDGKRHRTHFRTRDAARDFIAKLNPANPEATPAKSIDPRLAADADTARQRLASAGIDSTLAEAVRELVEAREALGEAGTLLEAARAFAASHAARTASKPFGEAVAAFIALKEETLREKTLASYRYSLERTLSPLDGRNLADITPDEFAAILGPKKPTARAMHLRNLRAFWLWACKEPRAWAETKVFEALEYRKDAGDADISILKPAEVRALLKAAESYSGNAACAFAIAIFAGVRMGELEKLRWEDIHDENIEIGRNVAKRSARRIIPICPALAAWLTKYRPKHADPDDSIVGPSWEDVSDAVRRTAGWRVAARLLDNPPKPTRGAWPQNVLRHTAASVLVATGTPLEAITFSFGHAGGHDLLRRHYVGRMTRKQALEILSIGPKGTKIETTIAA